MGNMHCVLASAQTGFASFVQKCWPGQDYKGNLMMDEIALVVAGSLIFGVCGMQLEGE